MEVDLNLPKEFIEALAAMNSTSSFFNSGAVIALFSGVIAILGGCVSHLFNLKSESNRRESERQAMQQEHENRLSEKVHDIQLEALKELSLIQQSLLPTVWPHPHYDTHEAYSDLVKDLDTVLKKLDAYKTKWVYVLPGRTVHRLNEITFLCNSGRSDQEVIDSQGYQPTRREIEIAKDVVESFDSAVSELKKFLRFKTYN